MMILTIVVLGTFTAIWGDKLPVPKKIVESVEYSLDYTVLSHDFQVGENIIQYEPSSISYSSIRLSHKDLTLSVSLQNDFSDSEDEIKYGASDATNIQLSSTYKRIYYELYYQEYKGYKILNFSDNIDDRISSLNIGANVVYFFDKSFSPATMFGHTEKNRINQGSPILEANISRVEFKSEGSLIPPSLQVKFPDFGQVKEVDVKQFALLFGYTGQVNFYDFYMLGKLSLGVNFANTTYKNSNLEDGYTRGLAVSLGFDLGYEFKRSLLGVMTAMSNYDSDSDENSFSQIKTNSFLYYRFFF